MGLWHSSKNIYTGKRIIKRVEYAFVINFENNLFFSNILILIILLREKRFTSQIHDFISCMVSQLVSFKGPDVSEGPT